MLFNVHCISDLVPYIAGWAGFWEDFCIDVLVQYTVKLSLDIDLSIIHQ